MTLLKILLVTIILLVLALSGMFFKLFFSKQEENKAGNTTDLNQSFGCGCGTGACCSTTS